MTFLLSPQNAPRILWGSYTGQGWHPKDLKKASLWESLALHKCWSSSNPLYFITDTSTRFVTILIWTCSPSQHWLLLPIVCMLWWTVVLCRVALEPHRSYLRNAQMLETSTFIWCFMKFHVCLNILLFICTWWFNNGTWSYTQKINKIWAAYWEHHSKKTQIK